MAPLCRRQSCNTRVELYWCVGGRRSGLSPRSACAVQCADLVARFARKTVRGVPAAAAAAGLISIAVGGGRLRCLFRLGNWKSLRAVEGRRDCRLQVWLAGGFGALLGRCGRIFRGRRKLLGIMTDGLGFSYRVIFRSAGGMFRRFFPGIAVFRLGDFRTQPILYRLRWNWEEIFAKRLPKVRLGIFSDWLIQCLSVVSETKFSKFKLTIKFDVENWK